MTDVHLLIINVYCSMSVGCFSGPVCLQQLWVDDDPHDPIWQLLFISKKIQAVVVSQSVFSVFFISVSVCTISKVMRDRCCEALHTVQSLCAVPLQRLLV